MKKLFAAVFAIVVSASAWSDTWTDSATGITWTYTAANGKAMVGADDGSVTAVPRGTSGAVTIPSTLGGSTVTSVGVAAFFGCTNLTSVTIPDGVTSLGSAAFENCSKMTNVVVGSGLKYIIDRPFAGCGKLKSFRVASGNADFAAQSGMLLSKDGTMLICGVNGSVTIPSGVVYIWQSAFDGYSGLTGVTIPSSVKSIGEGAFRRCSALAGVSIPNTVTNIGVSAFDSCTSLSSLTIANGVPAIGAYAFRGCGALASVTIPNSVKSIGGAAFENCGALSSATIGSGATNIMDRTFSGCGALASIQVADGNPSYSSSSGMLLTKDGKTLVSGVKGTNGTVSVPSGVTSIGKYAFENRSGLKGVTIPSSVKSIGARAFYGCTSLASMTIGSGVTSIGESAFAGCGALSGVAIPASVTSIGDWAFADCPGLSGLTSVTFAGGLEAVSMNAWRVFAGTPCLDAYVATFGQPANDDRANAVTISGRSGFATGTNVGAGSESGEALAGVWSAASPAWWRWATVWWKWTAPAGESVEFMTRGSGFDTVLGVFSLDSGNALTAVAECDDSAADGTSSVTFKAVKDKTYYIAVGGYASEMGDVSLRWNGGTKELREYGQLDTGSYAMSMAIGFDLVQEGVTLTNFPVLVRLSTAIDGFSYASFRKPKGGDLRFADADGKILPHEIDTWNESGVSTVWVRVPRLTKDTTIRAYYGCTGTQQDVDPADVWDLDYVGVWHLGEAALPLAESSMVSTDFETDAGTGIGYAAQGVVGGAVDFGASGNSRAVIATDHDALDGFARITVEAWTKQSSRTTDCIVSKRNGVSSEASYFLYENDNGTVMKYSANGTSTVEAGVYLHPELGSWNHQAYTLDATATSSNSKGYLNGEQKGTGNVTISGNKIYAGSANLHIGDFQAGDTRNFPGAIDEVRISKCVRSAAWIKATHDTIDRTDCATYTVTVQGSITPTDLVTLGSHAYTTRTFGSEKVRCYRDLAYGTRDDAPGEGAEYVGAEGEYHRHRSGNYYDLYAPESLMNSPEALADMPVFIYLHGGSWSERYDKDGSNGDFLGRVATNGYLVITMDYQLQNEFSMTGGGFTPRENASFADMLGDIDTMLTYLKTQLPTIGLTNTRVVIGGDSAGAHLSMCYAWDQNGANRLSGVSLRHDLPIACVTSVVGPSDLSELFGQQLAMYASLPPEYQAMMASSLSFFNALTGADVAAMLASGDTDAVNAVLANWSPVGLVDSESCHAILSYGYTNATVTASSTDGVVPISNFNSLTNALVASDVSYDARLFHLDHGSLSGGSEPSATWIVEKLGALRESFQNEEPARILYVNVEGSTTTNTLNIADVTEYITNIVKQGSGTLLTVALPNYEGDFRIEGGILDVGVKNGAGKDGYTNTIYVADGGSLCFSGKVNDIFNNKKLVFEGEGAASAPLAGKLFNVSGWNTIATGLSMQFKSATKFVVACWNRMMLRNVDVDMGGYNLTLSCSPGNQVEFSGSTFRNPGNINVGQGMMFYQGSSKNTFMDPPSGAGEIRLRNNSSYFGNGPVSASGWTIIATNSNTKIGGYSNKFPGSSPSGEWNGKIVFGKNSASFCHWNGGSGNTVLSNTVFNVKGKMSGSAPLKVGPGWLNLHTSAADNTCSGAVTVNGKTVPGSSTINYPILAGGGGIGLWNGAACFPNASSITFTNTARLAFMDNTACSVPNLKFIALAGETQSISGGVHTARSTIAGITKTGAGTLVVDSPVQVTGLADIQAGALKIAYRSDTTAQTQEAMLEPMPQFSSLKFASGTVLDLSDNVGMVLSDLEGAPCVTNSGMFGIGGKWKLDVPGEKLLVTSELATVGGSGGVLCFLPGATFDLADEAAFRTAASGADGLLVAEAVWILDPNNEQLQGSVVLPSPAQTLGAGWSMAIGKDSAGNDGRGLYLRYDDPSASGYAAWIAGKGITGANAASDKVTNGIANGVRYAFDIDPATSEIGTPILKVVRDANGNPSVQSRDLATGRDDVTFGILATPDLTDWSNAKLVPMTKFATDGLWKPTASGSSGYVFPSQMFFKYKVDIQE